ncbi:unnamed protein product [Lymnaea stagnalis]|uniref:ATP-dependent RNA helicase n=1 Tax=Lymnaea stagnalis TaxID=6523 RepID=A0AAV2HH52_LYMST
MDEDFANISLNLVAEDIRESKTNKIHGNRTSRVQQRKDAKNESEKERSNLSFTPKEDSAGRKRKLESDGGESVATDRSTSKKRKSDVVISSLFRKNPEIPVISSSEVDTVTENVFTGDAFKDLPIHPFLASNLEEKQGFTQLTEVQKRSIPILLQRKDALIKSQTGSGKTLAYAVPIVQSLQARKLKVRRDDGPYALVIVPTRELALQSYDTFQKLLKPFIWIVPGCLMGGEKRKAEKSRLRKGVNILVATPGRLMDHIKMTSVLHLARIQWLVIDEADRLLELGYERDISQIMNALKSQCPDPPQTVLLSATLSEGVERLSSITLNDPEHISVSDGNDIREQKSAHSVPHVTSPPGHVLEEKNDNNFAVPSQLKQFFIITPCKLRLVSLAAMVLWKCKYSKPASKVIVFISTQDSVHFHCKLFSEVLGKSRNIKEALKKLAFGEEEEEDVDVGDSDDDERYGNIRQPKKEEVKFYQLYGDMPQKERQKTFSDFTATTSGVLFCTDVAARGLDLPNVDWIIQFTSPGATVDYIHRVGRTARAGTKGHSLLFLMPSEAGYIQELNKHKISLTQMELSTVLQPLLANISDLPQPDDLNSKHQTPRTHEEAATFLQDRFEECILNDKEMHSLAGKGFQSFIRGYATYSKEAKEIFKVSDLHLGHVAKSFALREAPTNVHNVTAKSGSGQRKNKKDVRPSKRPLSFKQATLSEYSAGFQSNNKKIMAKPGGKRKPKTRKR